MTIYNLSIYQRVSPIGQLPCWLRSYVSNQLASNGKEWTRTFSRFNSGTYNNQWLIVDYKKFRPCHRLPQRNLLWMLEQIPYGISLIIHKRKQLFILKLKFWGCLTLRALFPFFPIFVSINLKKKAKPKSKSKHDWTQTHKAFRKLTLKTYV